MKLKYQKNLFIANYGTNQKITYLINPLSNINYHKKDCDKLIYPNVPIKELDCTCRSTNRLKLNSNFKAMAKRFIQKALTNFENVKELGFLTLTFRENLKDNIGLDIAFKQIKKFFRILKKKIRLDLKYCYVWEQQKRGSIHFHILIDAGKILADLDIIKIWLVLNPSAVRKAQHLDIVKVDTNKFIILYFSKYFSKQNHDNFKNRRVFLFSKNCDNPIKESLYYDWETAIKEKKINCKDYKNLSERVEKTIFKDCYYFKEFGYFLKTTGEFKVIGYVGYRDKKDIYD